MVNIQKIENQYELDRLALKPRNSEAIMQIFLAMDEVDHIDNCKCSRCLKRMEVKQEAMQSKARHSSQA